MPNYNEYFLKHFSIAFGLCQDVVRNIPVKLLYIEGGVGHNQNIIIGYGSMSEPQTMTREEFMVLVEDLLSKRPDLKEKQIEFTMSRGNL